MNNEIMTLENEGLSVSREDMAGLSLMDSLKNPENTFFCSIEDDGSRENKVAIYNALNSKGEALSDHIKETINLVDVAAHPVQLVDKQTGEISTTLRTILIADDGTCYQAVSAGVTSSLQKLFSIFGTPSWKEDPIPVMPIEEKTRAGYKVLTLAVVNSKKK